MDEQISIKRYNFTSRHKWIFAGVAFALVAGGITLGWFAHQNQSRVGGVVETQEMQQEGAATFAANQLLFIEELGFDGEKFIAVTDEQDEYNRVNLYFTDSQLTRNTAQKVTDIGLSLYQSLSFYVSQARFDLNRPPYEKIENAYYVAVQILGPGDSGDVIIVNDEGKVVIDAIDLVAEYNNTQNADLGPLVSFVRWAWVSEVGPKDGIAVWLRFDHFVDKEPQYLVRVSMLDGAILETVPILHFPFPYEYYTGE